MLFLRWWKWKLAASKAPLCKEIRSFRRGELCSPAIPNKFSIFDFRRGELCSPAIPNKLNWCRFWLPCVKGAVKTCFWLRDCIPNKLNWCYFLFKWKKKYENFCFAQRNIRYSFRNFAGNGEIFEVGFWIGIPLSAAPINLKGRMQALIKRPKQ